MGSFGGCEAGGKGQGVWVEEGVSKVHDCGGEDISESSCEAMRTCEGAVEASQLGSGGRQLEWSKRWEVMSLPRQNLQQHGLGLNFFFLFILIIINLRNFF
jgi:hypothetical protein